MNAEAFGYVDYNNLVEATERANTLQSEATALFSDPKSGAEEIEKAENMLKEASAIIDRGSRLNDIRTKAKKILDFPSQAQPDDPAFKTTNEFLRAVKTAHRGGMNPNLVPFHEDKGALSTKDLSGDLGASGGFMLTGERLAGVQAVVGEVSIVMPRATVLPMSGRSLDIVRVKQTGTTASQFHWYGGMIGYWEGEGDLITSSDMNFQTDTLYARILAALTYIPNTTLADSGDSLEFLISGNQGFGGVLANHADVAFLQGDGVGKPVGIINAGATLTASRATSSTIDYTDLIEIIGKTLPSNNLVWLANLGTREKLLGMAGPSGNASYLWGNATEGIPQRLLGYPIIFTEKVPALGSKGDIGLYDFSHYYIGDRQAITVETDTSYKFANHVTTFKAMMRVDGQPWIDTYFTLYDGSTTVSPFVVLAA